MAFSADGEKLAASCDQGLVYLFDAATGGELLKCTHDANGSRTYGVAFAPDGKTFASAGSDWHVRVWDASTGDPIFHHNVDGRGLGDAFAVTFSPDGRRVAAGCATRIDLIDVQTKKATHTIQRAHGEHTVALAFTPDGKSLVSGGYRRGAGGAEIRVWNAADGSRMRELSAKPLKLSQCSLALSQNGRMLVSAHQEGLVIWDFESGRVLRTVKGLDLGGYRTHGIAISPDGASVASIEHTADGSTSAGTRRASILPKETGNGANRTSPSHPMDERRSAAAPSSNTRAASG